MFGLKRGSAALPAGQAGGTPPNLLHLPNGINITVTNVFGGYYFKVHELNTHHGAFPPGWTIVIHSEDDEGPAEGGGGAGGGTGTAGSTAAAAAEPYEEDSPYPRYNSYRFRTPTLRNDALFVSSISNPSNIDFKPAVSPSRQIAMMLWSTLWWYFHQPRPSAPTAENTSTQTSSSSPSPQKQPDVRAEWRVRIKRDGIFKGRNLLSKLERMGLIASEHSCVGVDPDDRTPAEWTDMFVSQRAFWQTDARIFLFTLSPTGTTPYPGNTPYPSRPGSPNRESGIHSPRPTSSDLSNGSGLWSLTAPGPFASASHLPTYYPPPPSQYIVTDGVRHPLRPKPPRQGETFYTRYVPSMGQYLSFRAASLSSDCVKYKGPVGGSNTTTTPSSPFLPPGGGGSSGSLAAMTPGSLNMAMANSLNLNHNNTNNNSSPSPFPSTSALCDTDLLHAWMNEPRVNAAWGEGGPLEKQAAFLRTNLLSRHSFPVIGSWDGRPFGYFEIYWVKEDRLGRCEGVKETVGNYDRGFHMLVGGGEPAFRGPERVAVWMSALLHFCWLADQRTERVVCEPRVDNEKIIKYLEHAGFARQRDVAMPHKQAAFMTVRREEWESPCL